MFLLHLADRLERKNQANLIASPAKGLAPSAGLPALRQDFMPPLPGQIKSGSKKKFEASPK